MGKPRAPEPVSPQETASASTGTNIQTAIANTLLGQIGQATPFGSLSYEQSGTRQITDPYTGQVYDIPQFTATTMLSPEMEGIFGGIQSRLGDVVSGLGGSLDTVDIEQRLFDLGNERLQPTLDAERQALEQRLANQGLAPGSAAYETQMNLFNQRQNDAYNQLALTGRRQAMNEAIAERQLPINELTALLTGQQASVPQFSVATPSSAATTDVGGLINQNYAQQYGNYQSQLGNYNNIMGGLFGLGAAAISDVRLKKNIVKLTDGDLPTYEFQYKWEDDDAPMRRGYMAQDVVNVSPEAITKIGEWMAVDYSKLPEVS